MTKIEKAAHSSPLLRYRPVGHQERMNTLKDTLQQAAFTESALRTFVPQRVHMALASGIDVSSNYPQSSEVTKWQAAMAECSRYQRLIQDEDDRANNFLYRLAIPLMEEPPRENWGIIREGHDGQREISVPFTQIEIDAITDASIARELLRREGAQESGTAREFFLESSLFPAEVSKDLGNRPNAVIGILVTARAAEDALVRYQETAWEPGARTGELLTKIRALPDKLLPHKTAIR